MIELLHIHLLHPKLVHFPIALFIGAMGLECASFIVKKNRLHQTAIDMYILATMITPLVVLTGLQEAEHLHLNHPVLTLHKNFALWTMWISFISLPILWIVNKISLKMFRIVFFIFVLSIVTLVTIAGHNGGRLVYEYGVGVEE